MIRPAARLLLPLLLFTGLRTGGALSAGAPAFDGRKGLQWAVRQCALGPRVPGTPAHAAWIRMVRTHFDSLGVSIREEAFRAASPMGGDSLRLTNLVVSFRPEVRPRILLGAHWDSRPWADRDPDPARRKQPVPGANDGASGVAVLLVLADLLHANPPPLGVDLAFFDGEDLGSEEHPEQYCLGSRYMARHWPGTLPDWALVLDMVGSDRTEFGREAYSDARAPDLTRLIFQIARDKGFAEFNPDIEIGVVDDHLSFQEVGVPAADLIGFNDPAWHTHGDDPSNLSSDRLGRVGEVVRELVYGGGLVPH